jgi:hypothetical protein
MNTGTARFWVGCAVVVFALAASFMKMRSDSALLEASRRECAELRAQIDARDQTISDMREKLANQSQLESLPRSASPASAPDASWKLANRLEQLAVQQTNILALVQKLASKEETLQSGQGRLPGQERVVASLDAQATAQQQRLEAAKQKVEQLVLSLQVPDEVALMDAAAGRDVPGLKKYWPYFEAKRERDELQRFITIAKIKAESERLDLESETAKRPPQ